MTQTRIVLAIIAIALFTVYFLVPTPRATKERQQAAQPQTTTRSFAASATGEPTAQRQGRFALVIGNSHYEGGTWAPLSNPAHDAQAISKALRSVGFEIIGCGKPGPCLDGTRDKMLDAIRAFGRQLEASPGAIGFIYYSGHGVQARRTPDASDENFLIPVASDVEEEFEVATKAIPVEQLVDVMSAVGVQAGIVVLDACRSNGLRRTGSKAANSKGLALSESGSGGLLIAYAAEPGHVALDALPAGGQQVSPYARRLAEQLVVPGKSITEVFLDVRAEVLADTAGQQKPDMVMRLTRNLFLAGPQQPGSSEPPALVDTPRPEPPAVIEPHPTAPAAGAGSAAGTLTAAEMTKRGRSYERGTDGLARNETEAAHWYNRAAEQGDPDGEAYLGRMYLKGQGGLGRNEVEAARLFKKAAGQGSLVGEAGLAYMYTDGRGGLARDDTEAVRLLTHASERGEPLGEALLAFMYANGRGGLTRNDAEAVRLFTKAAKQGNDTGEAGLGVMYMEGRGGLAHDDTEAVSWLRKAAEQGNSTGETGLAAMYLDGRGGLARENSVAVRWLNKAADQGFPLAQRLLGTLYENGSGGLAHDDVEAVHWYKMAAEQGFAPGEAALGYMYEMGRGGLSQDDFRAVHWYTQAADQGDARGERALGFMYQFGRGGLARSDAQAEHWYTKAAQQGDKDAQGRLAALHSAPRASPARSFAPSASVAASGPRTAAQNLGDAIALLIIKKKARDGDVKAQNYLRSRGISW